MTPKPINSCRRITQPCYRRVSVGGVMYPLGGHSIQKAAPRFAGAKAATQSAIIGAISPAFASALNACEINSKLRIAHFIGQVTGEYPDLRTTEEFASGAACEGRLELGNTKPGDSERDKGRDLIQLTGRANCRRIGDAPGLPFEDKSFLAAEPVTFLSTPIVRSPFLRFGAPILPLGAGDHSKVLDTEGKERRGRERWADGHC